MSKDLSRWISLTKEFGFDASHSLPNMPEGHKCRNIHGHTYRVVIGLGGDIGEHGLLVDYSEIAALWEPIGRLLDHRHLNGVSAEAAALMNVPPVPVILEDPTTENLVHWILDRLLAFAHPITPHIRSVRVYESATTYAEASRHNTPCGRAG